MWKMLVTVIVTVCAIASQADQLVSLLDFISRFAGKHTVSFNAPVYISEQQTADRNFGYVPISIKRSIHCCPSCTMSSDLRERQLQ